MSEPTSRRTSLLSFLTIALPALLAVSACNGDGGTTGPEPVANVAVTPAQATVAVGNQRQLSAEPQDDQGNPLEGRTVSWSSDDETVATVDASTGLVTAVGEGTANISATSEEVSGTAAITVPAPSGTVGPNGGTLNFACADGELQFPANALAEETAITVQEAPGDSLPPANGSQLVTATACDFAPDGTDFAEQVQLTLSFDPADLEQGTREERLAVNVLQGLGDDGSWQPVANSTVDTNAGTASAPIDGFSIYALVEAPNQTPTAQITAPEDGSTFDEGEQIDFQGSATDPEDGALTGESLVWESDIDGQFGTGEAVSTSSLSPGQHTITLTATDTEGGTGTASITITVLGSPQAEITSPTDGSVFQAGDQIDFQGSADDPEDGALTGSSLVWESSIEGQIGTGESFSRNDLVTGMHTITLTATDSDGDTGTASVDIEVQGGPTVQITSPADGSVFQEGDQVDFQGSANDDEDGALTGSSLVWTSDLDGEIGTGESFSLTTLSVGQHTITLTATDSDGNQGSASVGIEVRGSPTAQITAPADGAVFDEGQQIDFQGSANDPEDGALTGGSLVWTSDLDGQIGTGESFSTALSVGTHVITLTATDSDGNADQVNVSITVNATPDAQITAPADGAVFDEGDQVDFQGSANDPEDGALTGGSLVWTSDIDGQIGTGGSFSTSSLSAGDHTITLTATDSDGGTGTASIQIRVNSAPTAQITSPADGSEHKLGDDILFEGSGSDAEDGALTGSSLEWTSDIDGVIGNGTSFTTSTLTAGTHTITLTATDSNGASTSVSIQITVQEIEIKAGDQSSATVSVGAQHAVPIQVDLSNLVDGNVGSVDVTITWDPAVLTHVETTAGDFGSAVINTENAASGEVRVAAFAAQGTTTSFTLANMTLEGAAAGSTTLTIQLNTIADEQGNDLSAITDTRDQDVTVQ